MAVHSNTFGGLRLTGEEAKKFRNQVKYGRNNAAAKAAAIRGRGMAETILKDGFVKIEA